VSVLIFFLLLGTVLLFAVCVGTLWWMLHAWRTPENYESTNSVGDDDVDTDRARMLAAPSPQHIKVSVSGSPGQLPESLVHAAQVPGVPHLVPLAPARAR
jgi:hypothetical protein